MSGLVGYDSSDDEDELTSDSAEPTIRAPDPATSAPRTNVARDFPAAQPVPSPNLHNPQLGPEQGPAILAVAERNPLSVPGSPYTQTRATLRNLTLPPIPHLDVPPSPPGSPPPGMEMKVVHFLRLKSHGVHFNAKLASSSALKNPALFLKLMAAAGLENDTQYASSLQIKLWDPSGFPGNVYKESLDKAQKDSSMRREAERVGKEREFVSAQISSGDDDVVRRAAPSAAERVMSGLNRDKKGSPGGDQRRGKDRWDERESKRRKQSRSRSR